MMEYARSDRGGYAAWTGTGLSAVIIAALGTLAFEQSPPGAAPTSARVEELGRLLFWDPILSGNRDVACATCHHPDFAYADGRALSLGAGAVGLGPRRVDASDGRIPVVKRNSPTVLNTAFNGLGRRRGRRGRGARRTFDGTAGSVDQERAPMFWDNRVTSLEAQALEPLKAMEEMRGTAYPEDAAVDRVVARLTAIPEYVSMFDDAFGKGPIDEDRLGRALAGFERSLIAMNSPVDRFQAGDTDALTEQQQRGLDAFDRVGCDRCHRGTMFLDFSLAAEGVKEHPLLSEPDSGAGRFQFRTPSLRNVALTPPYMHNGVLATLDDVLRFYDVGRSENPNVADGGRAPGTRSQRGTRRRGANQGPPRVDGRFRRVRDMSEGDMQNIIAFLDALTDDDFDKKVPVQLPSGLPVGGRIE